MMTDSHKKLAINGGEKIRSRPFPPWPDFTDEEIDIMARRNPARLLGLD